MSVKKGVELGLRRQKATGSWVQVERKALELWGQLAIQNSGAAQLLAVMISHMKDHNALVASQKTLAELVGCSVATIKRRLKVLKDGNWVEIRQMGPAGTTNAYVVNDRVAWQDKRDGIRYSLFSAAVLLSESEQMDTIEDDSKLQNLPNIFPNEMQLPTGDGLEPPSEPALPGLEHDLPARHVDPAQTDLEDFTGKPADWSHRHTAWHEIAENITGAAMWASDAKEYVSDSFEDPEEVKQFRAFVAREYPEVDKLLNQ